MNILSWSCRGLNDPTKVQEEKRLVAVHKLLVICLLETRVNIKNCERIQNKFGTK